MENDVTTFTGLVTEFTKYYGQMWVRWKTETAAMWNNTVTRTWTQGAQFTWVVRWVFVLLCVCLAPCSLVYILFNTIAMVLAVVLSTILYPIIIAGVVFCGAVKIYVFDEYGITEKANTFGSWVKSKVKK